jgi:hypothetical protein
VGVAAHEQVRVGGISVLACGIWQAAEVHLAVLRVEEDRLSSEGKARVEAHAAKAAAEDVAQAHPAQVQSQYMQWPVDAQR